MGETATVPLEPAPRSGWSAVPGQLWHQISAGRMSLIAAGCAFYATLALFPALSMLVSLYGLWFDPVTVMPQLKLLRDVLPPEALVLISRQVNALVTQPRVDLRLNVYVTAAFTLWSASTGTKSILSAIGHTHGRGELGLIRFQLTGLAMTLCAALAAVLTLATLVALPEALERFGIATRARGLLHTASLAVLVGFVWASIASLYHFGPKPGRTPMRVLPGSLLATAAWLGASVLFSIYVGRIAQFDATYGPLAAVAGVMLWFWVSTYIVLLGAETNVALTLHLPKRPTAP